MNIPWDAIIDLILTLLENCEESRRQKSAHNPLMQRWAVSKALRQEGFRGRELRAARVEVMQKVNQMSRAEIDDFVASVDDHSEVVTGKV